MANEARAAPYTAAVSVPRFYAPHAARTGDTIELPEEEAAHLTRVLRLTAGAEVCVFDGRGHAWRATVDRVSKQSTTVTLHDVAEAAAEARVALILAIAVLKGDKMDDIVRDAVMLGVAAIQPIITTRTEVSAAAIQRSNRVARWQRIAVSSAKQCGRAVVPQVHDPIGVDDVLLGAQLKLVLVEPSVGVAARMLGAVPSSTAATLLVGPEGGWTADEVRRAETSGAILITLGSATLRADAVPLVALTAVRVHWGDF